MSGDKHGGGEGPPRNMHALLFERMAEAPEVGVDLLLFVLWQVAPELAEAVDPARPPRARPGALSGPGARELRPDAAFTVWLRGCAAGFNVLLEQKTSLDPGAVPQLYWYAGGLAAKDLGHGVPFAELLSTLLATLYTGKPKWPERDESHLELQRLLARLALGSVVAVPPVVDLRRMALAEVRRTAGRAWPFLLAAWLRWRGEVGEGHLAEIAVAITDTPLGKLFSEVVREALDFDWEVMQNIKSRNGKPEEVENMATAALRLEARAKAATLVKLTRLKFGGDLPPERAAQVRDASGDELDRWLEGVILSDTLDGVFREPD